MAIAAIIKAHGGPAQFKLIELNAGGAGQGAMRIAHKAEWPQA